MICVLVLALAAAQLGTPGVNAARPLELTMDEAVEIGLAGSFRLQRSRRNGQLADERLKGTKGALGPRLDVNLGANQSQRYYNFDGTYDYNQATPQFDSTIGANASYELDISGIRKRQLQQARLSKEASAVDEAQASVDVAAEVRANYVQALRAQEQVTVDAEYLQLLDRLIERARVSQSGTVAFLESERSNAALTLEQSKQSVDLTFSFLRQTLRLEDDRLLSLTSKLLDPPPLPGRERLLSIAYENRNDLKNSEIRLKQARISRIQAMDSRRPTLRISAFASQALTGDTFLLGGDNHGRSRTVGAVVNFALPLFSYDGGQLAANRNTAIIQAEQAMADADEAKERARNEINQVLIGLNRARERLSKLPDVHQARQSLAQAEQQMLSAPAREAAGLLAQVTNARQNWKASVLSRNDALAAYYASYFQLQRSLGTETVQ